jgi:hypothetical protein
MVYRIGEGFAPTLADAVNHHILEHLSLFHALSGQRGILPAK